MSLLSAVSPSWAHLNLRESAEDREALAKHFEESRIREVECLFSDITGYPRGKLQSARHFAMGMEMRIAQAIPMQSVTGEYSHDPVFPESDPDIRLVPDLSTLRPSPWASVPRYLAIHDGVELTGGYCDFVPRSVLRRVLDQYAELGLKPVVAPEIEFYVVQASTDPAHGLLPPVGRGLRPEVGHSAFSLNQINELAPFWDEFGAALDTLGIQRDTWVHEVGQAQFEINLMHGDPLQMADHAFLFKVAAKELALRHGLNAVFMAKPMANDAGSSMHLHQSVVDEEGRNIFSLPDGKPSDAFYHFIGGLQTYTPDLMLIYAPTVNSYRRYVAGSQAPINLDWGHENRTSSLRVPDSSPEARRVENRLAGADANPYLAMAASLAAGLAGMEEKIRPRAPENDDSYAQPRELPRTLAIAMDLMGGSPHVRRLLGDRFVHAFLCVKQMEHEHFMREVTTWERRYLLPQV